MKSQKITCLLVTMLLVTLALSGHVSKTESKLVPDSKLQLELSYAPVVKVAAPAVVNIYTTRVVQTHPSPLLDDPIFRHFFGADMLPGRAPSRIQRSLGSGVIVSPDGIIITNNHVIRHATAIKVTLSDNREFVAEVVAQEERTDLAALRIKGSGEQFPYLKLRDADTLEVGDVVLAIGNPFGLGQTVTSGIVSALARTQIGVSDFHSFIQTDAAVNPGSSGGALITLDGRLVGINTAILSKSGGSIGISFATPSNLIVPIIESVKRGGKIIRPWIGATVQNLTSEIAKQLGQERIVGVIVTEIYPGSPAERGGLKVGDLITEIDEQEILNKSGFRFRIAAHKLGHKATFKIVRQNQQLTTVVTLEAPPEAPDKKLITLTGRHPLLGATVASLSPALANELGIDFMEKGVIILKLARGSVAHRIGLLPGDIIKTLNGIEVKSADDLARRLTRTRGGWTIQMKRGNKLYKFNLQA